MQIRNNYDKEVYNGDIGFVDYIDSENQTIAIKFDDRVVKYEFSELDELILAYATTAHKAQGSEFPIVVIPILGEHHILLQRNLIYTAITRSKNICVIVGTKKALSYAVKNSTVDKRNTLLSERIRAVRKNMIVM